jgi:MFS family permease
MEQRKLAANVPFFYVYTFLNQFILDRAIWILFLVSKGFTLAQIAVIETAYHLMNFLCEVPTGYVADRYGKRASLLISQLVSVVSSALLLWGGHWTVVVTGFVIGALAGTLQSGATSALVYETLKQLGREAQFKRYNSHLAAVMLVAMGLSGIAGGALSEVNWAWVYFGKVVLSVLALIFAYLFTEPHAEEGEDGPRGRTPYSFAGQLRQAYSFFRANRVFLSLSLYGTVLYSMSWSITFYSQVAFQNLGMNNSAIGVLNGLETWVSAAIAAVAFLGERLLGRKGSIVFAGIGYIGCLALFSASSAAVQAVGAYLAMALVISYLEPLLEAYLNEQLPSPIRATMLSVFSMQISAGMIVTFLGIGWLADGVGLARALQLILLVWVPVCLSVMVWAVKVSGKGRDDRVPDSGLRSPDSLNE